MLLRRTRKIWARKAQAMLFSAAGMQALLDDRERHALEDSMGFRGQWDEHRRFQIDELRKLGLEPKHHVLEIGCGPLTAGIPVIAYLDQGHYTGVDVRSSVLDLAWEQIGRAGLSGHNPRLIRSDDFASAELAGKLFDYVWSFSVLFHMTDEILDALMGFVATHLAPGGRFVANVMTDMDSSSWLEFPFLRRTVADYAALAKRHGLSMTDIGTIEQRGFSLPGGERTNPLLEFRLNA